MPQPVWILPMRMHHCPGARPILAGAMIGLAQISPGFAACSIFPFATAQPLVERFVFRPETLLSDYRDGGTSMISSVLVIAASSRAALQPLSRQVPRGSQRQREAIAAGLAIAAKMCSAKSREHARAIELVARDVTDATFQKEFRNRYNKANTDTDIKTRERAIAEALGAPKPDDGGRGTVFNPRDTRPVQPLGAVAPIGPIPSTVPPIR